VYNRPYVCEANPDFIIDTNGDNFFMFLKLPVQLLQTLGGITTAAHVQDFFQDMCTRVCSKNRHLLKTKS
jgi:hypothetical protein